MIVHFRVNNPEFGILHLVEADNAQSMTEAELRQVPTTAMLPKGFCHGYLSSAGIQKGQRMRIGFDRDWQIISIFRDNGEWMWSK